MFHCIDEPFAVAKVSETTTFTTNEQSPDFNLVRQTKEATEKVEKDVDDGKYEGLHHLNAPYKSG